MEGLPVLPAVFGVASAVAIAGVMCRPYLVARFVRAPPVSAKGRAFLRQVDVVGHSVLGTRLVDGKILEVDRPPLADEVVVDPANLALITGNYAPSRAGQASAAIYKWAGLWEAPAFPAAVWRALLQPGDAQYYRYAADRHVIHIAVPDIRLNEHSGLDDDAVLALRRAYANVLAEAVAGGQPRLRLLPLSAGVFSGPFRPRMPHMTFHALGLGFDSLPAAQQEHLLRLQRVQMCIFVDHQLAGFREAHQELAGVEVLEPGG